MSKSLFRVNAALMAAAAAVIAITGGSLMNPSSAIAAQETVPPKMDAAERSRVIDGVLRRLNDGYVFPEVAGKMAAHVRERAAAKAYDNATSGSELARLLTADLRAVSHDQHIRVEYSPEARPADDSKPMERPAPEFWEEMRRQQAQENYGLTKAEVLRGNIGYVNFRFFTALEWAHDTYAGAMNVVANTDALIIDLRECGGSMSPDAIPFVCSYLFAEPTHLNSIYWRPSDETRQFWTQSVVPGRRYLDKPVYVLTSGQTFSGAEELAYDLQNLKRATIVGDVTGGGANPGGTQWVDAHFSVWVPVGRAINPISKTNWEGVGVIPDKKTPAPLALLAAHEAALESAIVREKDARRQEHLKTIQAELAKEKNRFHRVTLTLKGRAEAHDVRVAGSFNNWSPRANRLERKGDVWVAEIVAEPGEHSYKFVVDGEWITDPGNPKTVADGENTNSYLHVK